jgi:hypothetical protein
MIEAADLRDLLASAPPGTTITIVAVTLSPAAGASEPAAPVRSAAAFDPRAGDVAPAHAGDAPDAAGGADAEERRAAPAGDALLAWSGAPERREPYTAAELATMLQLTPDTIAAWCRKGLVPGATRPGRGGWRIPPSAVVRLLAARPPGADAPGADVPGADVQGESAMAVRRPAGRLKPARGPEGRGPAANGLARTGAVGSGA